MSSASEMETRRQEHEKAMCDLLLTNKDPTMRAGFDAVSSLIAESLKVSVAAAVSTALKDTTAKLDELLPLEARSDGESHGSPRFSY